MKSDVKLAAAVVTVGVPEAIWVYQMMTPSVGADPGLYAFGLVAAFAGAITLFGRGTIKSALDMMEKVRNGD